MKVSELARAAGVTPATVRFYEAQGILPGAARRSNGYRDYDADDLCRLRLVVTLRGLGLDLPESGRLAALCSSGRCDEMAGDLLERLTERQHEVAAARAELEHLEAELANLERVLREGRPHATLCLERRRTDDPAVRLPVRT